jgi:beta-alanine--pyruvate transaminase
MGGIIASKKIHDAFMGGADHQIELFHGHTYSAHPLACAAALATLDLYRDEDLFARAAKLEPVLESAVHQLRGAPFVTDIRNVGLAAAIELESDSAAPGRRGYEIIQRAFSDENMVVRVSGDTIALSPPLIASEEDLASIVAKLRRVLQKLA